MKTATINSRIEPALKAQAESIFAELGLSTSEAITLFYKQVSFYNGLPFEVKLPNAETKASIDALESGQGEAYDNFNDLLDEINFDA